MDEIYFQSKLREELILFEDEEIIVINKPSGIFSRPTNNGWNRSIQALLKDIYGDEFKDVGGLNVYGCAHRLDADTSGIMLIARSQGSVIHLQRQFRKREPEKMYLALVSPCPMQSKRMINKPISVDEKNRYFSKVSPSGKKATTFTEIKATFGPYFALLSCQIESGRTHQIRVHLSSEGTPVIGDWHYGYRPADSRVPSPSRILLHSSSIEFRHPKTRRIIRKEAPLPLEFENYINLLRETYL